MSFDIMKFKVNPLISSFFAGLYLEFRVVFQKTKKTKKHNVIQRKFPIVEKITFFHLSLDRTIISSHTC